MTFIKFGDEAWLFFVRVHLVFYVYWLFCGVSQLNRKQVDVRLYFRILAMNLQVFLPELEMICHPMLEAV